MIVKKLNIFGKVQGVSYRATMRDKAKQLGIKGYNMNLSDGSVEGLIIGSQSQINEMINWCYQGPKFAKVKKIEITNIKNNFEIESIKDFTIKY